MEKPIKPGSVVKISEDAKEGTSEGSKESEYAGMEGIYIGDVPINGILYASIEFENGAQSVIPKQYIKAL